MRFPKPNKYKAQRTMRGELSFPSKLEAAVYDILNLMEKNGLISELELQPSVKLTNALIGYKPDFKYLNHETNDYEWVEAKGTETDGYRLRKKLWKWYGPGKLIIYKGTYRSPRVVEVINPKMAA